MNLYSNNDVGTIFEIFSYAHPLKLILSTFRMILSRIHCFFLVFWRKICCHGTEFLYTRMEPTGAGGASGDSHQRRHQTNRQGGGAAVAIWGECNDLGKVASGWVFQYVFLLVSYQRGIIIIMSLEKMPSATARENVPRNRVTVGVVCRPGSPFLSDFFVKS